MYPATRVRQAARVVAAATWRAMSGPLAAMVPYALVRFAGVATLAAYTAADRAVPLVVLLTLTVLSSLYGVYLCLVWTGSP